MKRNHQRYGCRDRHSPPLVGGGDRLEGKPTLVRRRSLVCRWSVDTPKVTRVPSIVGRAEATVAATTEQAHERSGRKDRTKQGWYPVHRHP